MSMNSDTTLPQPNVNPDAYPWARDISRGVYGNSQDLDKLEQRFGESNELSQSMKDNISLLFQQLRSLYATTGTPYPPGPPAPPTPPTPPPVPTTIVLSADWSRTWGGSSYYTGGGNDTNGSYLYQGSNPENKIGIWHFNIGPAAGKQITGADMFLANINTPYSPVVTAGFGTHGFGAPPVGKPGRTSGFDVSWGRGEAKWFPLPDWTYAQLSSGAIQGFSIGGIGASDANYGYWQGVGLPAPPALRLTYNN